MQPDPDSIRILHMLEAAREAIGFAAGLDHDQLAADVMRLRATVKTLEIIGEAASKISAGVRAELPDIAWQDIIGMRQRLVHAYFDIDVRIVANTVAIDLPPLIERLERWIAEHPTSR